MKRKPIQHHIDGLAALLLFGVFAVCVLAVLLTGADAYRRLTQRDRAAYDRRTATQYIATRVRQADLAGNVTVRQQDGIDVLILDDNWEYVTYIYCYEGWLMELYSWAGEPMAPQDGSELLEAESLTLSLEDGLLTAELVSGQGEMDTLLLSLRSGEEAAA